MKTKHTTGPWKVKHSESKRAFNVVGTVLGARYKIARCPYITGFESEKNEAEANAKLIAAAPEMLEALIELNREAQNSVLSSNPYNKGIDTYELLKITHGLIKKAM